MNCKLKNNSNDSNTIPACILSVPFAVKCFSIRTVQDLRDLHEYGYSRIKKPQEYGYSRVEEPHKYRYFRTEEPHGYEYHIVKKLDGNI